METNLTGAMSDAVDGAGEDGTDPAGRDAGDGLAATSGGVEGRRARGARIVHVLVLLLPSLVLLERGWARRWVTDDGFINMRVARMIVDGHGPVFNVGERVEVTTSTLWVWTIAAGDLILPLRMEWVAVSLGLAFAVIGLAAATFAAARLHRHLGAPGPMVPLGALVVAATMPFWDFATSGLEGGLTFGWMGVTSWLLARWATGAPRSGPAVAVVAGLAPLVRPDLALAVPVVVGGMLAARWADDRISDRIKLVVSALAIPVAYQIFRMGYFAAVVPNTALAKAGGRSRWGEGFSYLRDLVQPYWLVIPLACLAAAVLVPALARCRATRDRPALVALVALPLAGLLDGLYVVRVGGDYMHGRLLLPALFALLLPVAAVPLPRRSTRAAPADQPGRGRHRRRDLLTVVALGVTAGWALVCLVALRPAGTPVVADLFSADAHANHVQLYGDHAVTLSDQGWDPESDRVRLAAAAPVIVGGRPVDVVPPDDLPVPVYASYGIGNVGYALGPDVYMIDQLGLADPVGSRFTLSAPGLTGHEKPMPPAWLAARISSQPVDPAQLEEPPLTIPLHVSSPGSFDDDTEAARLAIRCGALAELDEAVRGPMSARRFASNLAGALRFTSLEVPPDPQAARERFC